MCDDLRPTSFYNVIDDYFGFLLYVKFIFIFCVYPMWLFYVQETSIMGIYDVPTLDSKVACGIHCANFSTMNPQSPLIDVIEVSSKKWPICSQNTHLALHGNDYEYCIVVLGTYTFPRVHCFGILRWRAPRMHHCSCIVARPLEN